MEELTLSSGDSHVKTSQSQEDELVSKVSGADYGMKCLGSSRSSDRILLLLKTYAERLISPSTPSKVVWKLRTTKSKLSSYLQLRLVPRTKGIESSSLGLGKTWPTPTTVNRNSANSISQVDERYKKSGKALGLEQATEVSEGILPREIDSSEELPSKYKSLWATPTVSESNRRRGFSKGSTYELSECGKITRISKKNVRWSADLTDLVVLDSYEKDTSDLEPGDEICVDHIIEERENDEERKLLNPDWVEQLMGFPEGWTDVDRDKVDSWKGWPALLGEPQYNYEFPRLTDRRENRAHRIKSLGNAVVPQQALFAFQAVVHMNEIVRGADNETQSEEH